MVFTEVPQATNDHVFEVFADGQYSSFNKTVEASVLADGHVVLFSHEVPIAIRSEECVVFDARPCRLPTMRTTCNDKRCEEIMKHVGRAGVFVHAVFGDDEVYNYDHHSFVELCDRLGVS